MKTLIITEKEEIEQIIAKCTVCFVGLADTDLTPYVIPMNFGYKEGTVYLHSAQEGRSIDILSRNPQICITFSTDHALVFQHPRLPAATGCGLKALSDGEPCFLKKISTKRKRRWTSSCTNILKRVHLFGPCR